MYGAHYSCQILMKLVSFRRIFEKNTEISTFMKLCPVGAEILSGQTWRSQ